MKFQILVVDDIKKNIQVLGSMLGREGYAVSYATNGTKAIGMAEAEAFDLILLDVMMPGMDGFEVCRHLKQNPKTREIPILFLTAKSEQDEIVQGLEQGAVDYLTKPFNKVELAARVKTQLNLRQAQTLLKQRNVELEEKAKALEQLLEENQKALSEIKTLRGILPICAQCKKVRNDQGYWKMLETYLEEHSYASFTHGLCPECCERLYGHEEWYVDMKKNKDES